MTIYFYKVNEPYGCFSNFSPHGVELQGIQWSTVEHYYQAQKFVGTMDAGIIPVIQAAATPEQAAALGRDRTRQIRPDWEQVKTQVMRVAVLKKFLTHKDIQTILISTGDELLVENSPTDYYWGCGNDETGDNHLGKILMSVRQEIRQQLTTTPTSDFIHTLAHAVAALRNKSGNRPFAKEVVNALLQAEKAAKQQRLTYPVEFLLGNWRLYFTAPRQARLKGGVALGKGFYIPQIAPAQISFTQISTPAQSQSQLEITNQIQLGSLLFKLTGPAQYLGKKNLLMFNFTQMQLMLFGRTIYTGGIRGGEAAARDFYHQSIAKLPFFAFFLITEDFIAARGRGGGLALWVKE